MTERAASVGDRRAVRGVVFNLQRCSIHDGPGVRTTVFVKGCPLRCAWCHNPESRAFAAELAVNGERCISCGACARACPAGSRGARPGTPSTGGARCEACGACATACPTGARRLLGEPREPGELVAELERDRPFFDASGGGVTFSGGEPLAQPDFLLACLRECRSRGLHTAVDTCGYGDPAVMRAVAASTDLLLFDLKVADREDHRRHTGVANDVILANLREASATAPELWLRIPLIPGVNGGASEIDGLGTVAAALPRRHPVFVLPYHDLAAGKRARLGEAGGVVGFRAPGEAELAATVARLARFGLRVSAGGAP